MKSQTFKKLMTIFLSTAITFSIAGIPHALCLGDPSTSDSIINKKDERTGMTPLLEALEKRDVDQVRELLSKGARLDIPYTYRGKNLNPMEFLGSKLSYWAIGCDRDYGEMTKQILKANLECGRILLEHCAKNNIKLHVDPNLLKPRKDPEVDVYLWNSGLSRIFDSYIEIRPDLFSRKLAEHELDIYAEMSSYCRGDGKLMSWMYENGVYRELRKYVPTHQPTFPFGEKEYIQSFLEYFTAGKNFPPDATPESTPYSSRESTPYSSRESTPYSSPESTPYSSPELTPMPEPEESEPLSTPELGCLEIPEL